MARVKLINMLVLAAMLSGCAQFGPFVDRRREAGVPEGAPLYVGKSTPKEPAICYNKIYTDYAEVKALADAECVKYGTGTHAVPVKETVLTCRLLVPNHYYFRCEK